MNDSVVSPYACPALNASTFASARSGRLANFSRRNRSVPSVGRWYIHDSRPRANMFFARSASFLRQAGLLQRAAGQRRHRDLVHRVALERAVVQRRAVVADLGQVPLGELVGVDDQDAARGQVGDVRLQRGGVHRDQHVRAVAGGEDVVVREVQLERRHTRQRPGGRADLRREVREGGQVVAERRGLRGEPVAGQLHAVAGVTGEPDDDPVPGDDLACGAVGGRHVAAGPRVDAGGCIRG